jgi:hypothetical protein
MKYMMLIYQGSTPLPGTPEWDALSDEERGQVYKSYQDLNQTEGFASGEQMQSAEMATTVRAEGHEILTTDGPFPESKEALGGYCFFEAEDLDAAIALAATIPAARMGGAVEIRPMVSANQS